MTHPVYNRQQLERMKRSQLWVICEEIGVHRFAKIVDLVEAILEKMPQLVEAVAVEEIIAKAEPKPEAKIINDDQDYEPWVLFSDGVEIVRGRTYLKVFNSPSAKNFEIINVDDQTCFNSLAVWEDVQLVIEETSVEQDDEPAPTQNRKKGLKFILRQIDGLGYHVKACENISKRKLMRLFFFKKKSLIVQHKLNATINQY